MPVPMGTSGRPIYEGLADPRPGIEYGRDPRGQARTLEKSAINNSTMNFRGGRRVQ